MDRAPPILVRNADHDQISDLWVFAQRRFDFGGVETFAPPVTIISTRRSAMNR
jgi:hypothetical protein